MELMPKYKNIDDDDAALNGPSVQKTELEIPISKTNDTPLTGSSRGYLLWRSLKNIRKFVSKVSEPLSKSRRRSLRRQLSFEVDDLERIVLGVNPRVEDDSDESDVSRDEGMRAEVEALVKDVMDTSTSGKLVSVDHFESRMKQLEKECAEMKRKMEEMKGHLEPKRKKTDTHRAFHKLAAKSPSKSLLSGYGSDDHGYEGSMDLVLEQGARSGTKKQPAECPVCGKMDVLYGGWRCTSCRNFWNRLIRLHAKGKVLPHCNHWEPTVVCKGCRRRKYESAMATHCPKSPLGLPPCPPPLCPVDPDLLKEERREICIEYW